MNRPKYIDTHCHLFESDFEKDSDEVITKIKNTGVEYILLANTGTDSIKPLLNFEKKYPYICQSMIGIHPVNVDDDYKSQIKFIEKNLSEHNFIGIGEIGLDYHDAFEDSLEILKKYQNGNLSGVIHCFTGDAEQARKCLDLGFFLGIGGIVTFKNSSLPKTLNSVPLDRIVIETDSPCLAPAPFRGQRNDSSFLPLIVDKIAEIYNSSHNIVAEITTTNAKNVFKLK